MKNDKWNMFKNYMHNELGITKEDIRNWIQETIQKEIKLLVNNSYDNFNLNTLIKNEIYSHDMWSDKKYLKKDIKEYIAKELIKNVELTIKEK
jgi:serine protease inhibitor